MNFLALMDQPLKSAEIIEILELHDMKVVYEFDRLFEGTDDEYLCESAEDGFEFHFDAQQRLATVFLYIRPRGKFSAVDAASLDVPVHASIAAARDAFLRDGLAVDHGDGYVKAFIDGVWRHYEFRDGQLSMITLMRDAI